MKQHLFYLLIFISFLFPPIVHAQELVEDKQEIIKAEVLEVISEEKRLIPGTDTNTKYQTIKIRILEGEEKSKELTLDNDYLSLEKGDIFYLVHTTNPLDGRNSYAVSDPYRLPIIYFFIALFLVCLLMFGGMQGLRGFISLVAGFFLIMYVLFPLLLKGYPPLLLSVGISSLIIIVGSYITHGFNKTTTSAVLGMLVTIIITGILAYLAVHYGRLSGFNTDEAVYLNFNTRGLINFEGLLLGSIMIGLLGVLYDIAIGQAVSVEELKIAGPNLSRQTIYTRAIRIGREHIGALVNSLAIAYVGASLPLLLLFYSSNIEITRAINQEIFATEIIRIIIGSIGLILAVPITTLIAVFILKRDKTTLS